MARRSINGVFCIAKPPEVTSRWVVDEVAKRVRNAKAGHTGTLDPMATGVLVVCVGWTTRLVPLIQEQTKRYSARFRLGVTSDTDDSTGSILSQSDPCRITHADLLELLPKYTGTIEQIPPDYSAVHTGGERAYHLARQGKPVALPPRRVEVKSLALTEFSLPDFQLEIECGSGTYVRSLGRDMGRDLGCGALMTSLVRQSIGQFHLEQAVPVEALDQGNWRSVILPPLAAVAHFPRYVCTRSELELLLQGRLLSINNDNITDPVSGMPADIDSVGMTVLLCPDSNLIGIGEWLFPQQRIQPRHVFPDAIRTAIPAN